MKTKMPSGNALKLALLFLVGIVVISAAATWIFKTSFWEVISVIGGSFTLLFLPGFSLTYALFLKGEIDALERLVLSVALSIATVPLVVFFANRFLGVKITLINSVGAILLICAVGVTVYYVRRRGLM